MFNPIITNMKEDIISSTCELIKIPSVLSSATIEKPFGENCAKALDYILNLGKKLGFRTKNVDGYCGYIEFGKGNKIVGIIGHLDVVPASGNWTFPPFSATISDGKIFGRGSIDDKGPVVSTLYAMKAVMDNCTVNKRVRLIIGLNEENDWKCINYYKEHEETPTIGFSPDADFPCIYAEKALLNVHFSQTLLSLNNINIVEISDNCNAINVVPKYCKIKLLVDPNHIDTYIEDLKTIIDKYNNTINIEKESEQYISVISHGISAHSAHPNLGNNAISNLLVVLYEFFKKQNINIPIISYFYNFINLEYNGKSLGINFEDESGPLTFNVAQIKLENNIFSISANLRIPVNTSIETIKNKINNTINNEIDINYDGEKNALYIDPNSKLVTTLCNIFNETTGLNKKPIAIGGATYARAFKNCISFGANMPGNKDMCHQVDEFISIDNLILSCNIYAKAIYNLCQMR